MKESGRVAIQPLDKYDGHINTRSRISKLNFFDPQPDQIHIEDIAAGLAFKGHFAGQSPKMFSIAQHSVMVAEALIKEYGTNDKSEWPNPDLPLVALLHDASEAYLGDMLKPVKIHPEMAFFRSLEDNLTKAIFAKYGLDVDDLPLIKKYDHDIQVLEYEAFYKDGFIKYWSPTKAYNRFLQLFEDLI